MRLVCDIGGTKTRVALANEGSLVGEPVIFETQQDYNAGMAKLKQAAAGLITGVQMEGAVVGLPGPLDSMKMTIVNAPNLPDWKSKPIMHDLEGAWKIPVTLENDVALASVGEAVKGAGKGSKIMAYISIGTGIGGARTIGGELDTNALGFEPGHHLLFSDGDSRVVDWEYLASGKGILKRSGRKAEEISDETFWTGVTDYIALGIANTIVFWSPDLVVLGGGLLLKSPVEITAISAKVRKLVTIFPLLPDIRKAELGELAGLNGGAVYSREK